jgi:hypothetical protein
MRDIFSEGLLYLDLLELNSVALLKATFFVAQAPAPSSSTLA